MPRTFAENLTRISSSSSQLNELAKQINEQIAYLDNFLRKHNVGVEYFLSGPFTEGHEENRKNHRTKARYWLGYARTDDGDFGLVISAEAQATDDDGTPQIEFGDPVFEEVWIRKICDARRGLRIVAVKRIPELIEQLADWIETTKEQLGNDLAQTAAIIEEIAKTLKVEDVAQPPKKLK